MSDYKVLTADRRACQNGHGRLAEPKNGKPGRWSVKRTPVMCKSGWHRSDADHLALYIRGEGTLSVWECEGRGKTLGPSEGKYCSEQMRLTRFVGTLTDRQKRLLACRIAEDVLPNFERVFPDDDRPRKAIETARRHADGLATDEELAAAGSAAESAAESAAWSAASAAGSARSAAGSAGSAAGSVAGSARSAAWSTRSAAGSVAESAASAAWSTRSAWSAAESAAIEKYSGWVLEALEVEE